MIADAAVSPVVRFPLGVAAGVAATLAMDVVAARLPEGSTPPTVAAGVLTQTHPDAAPRRLARVVHYLAGGLTGPLFVWLLYAAEAGLGPSATTTAATAAALLVLMVGFFVAVPLPRAPGLDAARARSIARDWAASALAYVAVGAPLVHLGSVALAG